jgi:hypothetical protein
MKTIDDLPIKHPQMLAIREAMSEIMGSKVGQSNVKALNAGFE